MYEGELVTKKKVNRSLMEKLVRSCDKEYMKMAMLKHEETFKQQVLRLLFLFQFVVQSF